MTIPTHGHYIAGNYSNHLESASLITSINPATNEAIYQVQKGTSDDIDKAVSSAKQGFALWQQTPLMERSRILARAAGMLRENNDILAKIEVLDTGKPIQEASTVDIVSAADCIEYFAHCATSIHGQHIPFDNAYGYTRREPLGVCVGIGAWNYPLQIAAWKSAPALICGNAMIFKPSELSALSALKLAEIYKQAGLPDGVFNVITGDGQTGELLCRHKDIAKVSFTGSVPSGKKVIKASTDTLKNVTLELGGKSPLIIFEDANIDDAVSAAMMANFYTQGEICSNGTRVFVAKSILNKFLAQLTKRTKKIILGPPLLPQTQMGPLISKEHLNRVLSYIDSGISEGAQLHFGGQVLKEGLFSRGNFIQPTIFTQCHDKMRIVTEEIFGPVMSILTFEDEKEVIERANNSDYGLAAGVFTANMALANRVIERLQAGMCWLNNYNITPIALPFGGYKQSGIGRENGLEALDYYTQTKSVYVEFGQLECPYG
jgi:betaine-aldehyde dehydrogenase